jgi:hypothetical protein
MKLFKTCLLLLLSIALPVQAAMAAGMGSCLRHTHGAPASAVAQAQAVGAATDEGSVNTDCQHHQVAQTPTASADPGCSACGDCCLGNALPSTGLHLQAHGMQSHDRPQAMVAHASAPLRVFERPPRAPAATV